VQAEIEKAIYKLTGNNITVHGAGRTDADVHALGQVFHFDTDEVIPAERYAGALNTKLPWDIRAISSELVSDEFHSRFDKNTKHYKYKIINRRRPIALERHRAWHVIQPLNVELMREGAKHFLGEHDFAGFMAAHSDIENTVRTIYSLDIVKNGEEITIDIEGNGFLRNMVRIIAGTLVNVGSGKTKPEEVPAIIKSKDRDKAGMTAPGYGLYLVQVKYE
jgi:tRNA pseudouridine38-40 synthase